MSPLPCSPFLQNFKIVKKIYDLVFHQVDPMKMYFHRRGHVFVVQKFEIDYVILCIPFDYYFKKCSLNI